MPVQIYANLISQPCRALVWALKVKDADWELVQTDLGSDLIKSQAFLELNPNGFVPVLKDGDFALFEGNAILVHVAETLGWTDLHPTDLKTRAKVNEFLHWHHANTRVLTTKIVRPTLAKLLGTPLSPADAAHIGQTAETIARVSAKLETLLVDDYIARTSAPTIADFVAYCEFDQLELMGHDFGAFPNVHAWLQRMKTLPFYAEVRAPLVALLQRLGFEASLPLSQSREEER